MKIEDRRPSAFQTEICLVNIPMGTVFQGTIGDSRGTFMRVGEVVVGLDRNLFWVGLSGRSWTCKNYQPVHGRIVIERNA